jgi:hypothetical protein
MARAQNSAKGRFTKKSMVVPTGGGLIFGAYGSGASNLLAGNSTGLTVAGGVRLSGQANATLTGNSTGLIVAGGVKVANQKTVSANSTGWIFTAAATKPATRSAAKIAFLTNSTGKNTIMVNTTGTTWKYLYLTSAINSTSGY